MIKKIILSTLFGSCCFSTLTFSQGYSSAQSYIIESNQGIIVDKKLVQFQNADSDAQGIGTAVGAVSGGLIGSTLGRGRGHVAGAIGGAVIGGLFGNSVGKSVKHQSDCYMFDYTIRTDQGALINVWQYPDINLRIGQKVLFERSNDGRSFLLPQY